VSNSPASVFISYVPEDDPSVRALEKQLAPLRNAGKITTWSSRAISAGDDVRATIGEHFGAADVILLLISADYLATEAAGQDMAAALRRREAEGAAVVPVLVRPCLVEETPLGRLRPLPDNGEPIEKWANKDDAWLSVAQALRDLVAERLQGRRGARPPPLPRAPHFLGRDAIAGEVTAAIVAVPSQPMMVLGGPGIGKTTLSLAVLHRPEVVKRFGARRLFARLDSATSGAAALGVLAGAAGLLPGADLRAALCMWLAEAPALVVLDNIETPHDADREGTEALIGMLAEVPDVAVLASRRGTLRPAGAAWKSLQLKPLSPPLDVELFCTLAPEHAAQRAVVAMLVAPLGGVPLAIALLAHAAQGNDLANLRAEQRTRRTAALAQGGTDKHASWAACVDVSFRSSRMTDDAARLTRVLARLPEGAAAEDLPQLLSGAASASAPSAARVLVHVGLAYFENGRLRMLPPLRDHVAAAHPAEAIDYERTAEHYRVLAQTLGPRAGGPGGREAIARLTPEWANIEEMLRERLSVDAPALWIDAAAALRDFVRFSGRGTASVVEAALIAAERINDTARAAACACALGDIALARSDHDEARARFEDAMPLYRHARDMLGEARCILSLGDIALARSDHREARTCIETALPLYRQVGYVLGEAHCILSLGDIALARSEHEDARSRYETARPLYRQVGDLLGEANCIQNLGHIALARSDPGEARVRYEAALPLYQQVGSVLGEANCIRRLGDIALFRLDHGEARARYEAALPLYRQVGSVLGEANCIKSLGDTARAEGRHEDARARYQGALTLYGRIPAPYSMGMTHRWLARIAPTDADRRWHVEAARQLWTGIDRPDLAAELALEFGVP
jgi:tetratricopeptide (TPR) repeat protein